MQTWIANLNPSEERMLRNTITHHFIFGSQLRAPSELLSRWYMRVIKTRKLWAYSVLRENSTYLHRLNLQCSQHPYSIGRGQTGGVQKAFVLLSLAPVIDVYLKTLELSLLAEGFVAAKVAWQGHNGPGKHYECYDDTNQMLVKLDN